MDDWYTPMNPPPYPGQEVLTCHAEMGVYNACIYNAGKFESLETGDDLTADVTHWRDLPALPEFSGDSVP